MYSQTKGYKMTFVRVIENDWKLLLNPYLK